MVFLNFEDSKCICSYFLFEAPAASRNAQRAKSLGPTWTVHDLWLWPWDDLAACSRTAVLRHRNCAEQNALSNCMAQSCPCGSVRPIALAALRGSIFWWYKACDVSHRGSLDRYLNVSGMIKFANFRHFVIGAFRDKSKDYLLYSFLLTWKIDYV